MEADLIFHHDVELPHFAAFPLLDSAEGQALLQDYYDGYAAIARAAGAGLMLESPTWRASSDWGERLGYSPVELARANTDAIGLLARLRDRYAETVPDVVLSGMVGPRGDGYRPGGPADPIRSADYHHPQIKAFAWSGADMVTAYTLTDVGEAIGIVQAARAAGLPVAISFTVETDGGLPGGVPLGQAICEVDDAAGPDYFLVNCAHPCHVAAGLAEPGAWCDRIVGLRCNASVKSHVELDDATELDEGDPMALAAEHDRITPQLPRLAIIGGCCGTDTRHIAALWTDRGRRGAS
ncbi:MAG: homocysteine S-methyltransferase family protein [Pseudonocardia sp.]|nr:homocysteine S-methyltransferase family protein [Pseudonocardia sp.]